MTNKCRKCFFFSTVSVCALRFPLVDSRPSTTCVTQSIQVLETRWRASSWERPWNISTCSSLMTLTWSALTSTSSTLKLIPCPYGRLLFDNLSTQLPSQGWCYTKINALSSVWVTDQCQKRWPLNTDGKASYILLTHCAKSHCKSLDDLIDRLIFAL